MMISSITYSIFIDFGFLGQPPGAGQPSLSLASHRQADHITVPKPPLPWVIVPMVLRVVRLLAETEKVFLLSR